MTDAIATNMIAWADRAREIDEILRVLANESRQWHADLYEDSTVVIPSSVEIRGERLTVGHLRAAADVVRMADMSPSERKIYDELLAARARIEELEIELESHREESR